MDLSNVLEMPYTRLCNLLREKGCSDEELEACPTIQDVYRIAPRYLTLPEDEQTSLLQLRQLIGWADPASTRELDLLFFLRATNLNVHQAYENWSKFVQWRTEYTFEIKAELKNHGMFESELTQTDWHGKYTHRRCDKCNQYHPDSYGTPRECKDGKTSKEIFDEQLEAAQSMTAYDRAAQPMDADINYRTMLSKGVTCKPAAKVTRPEPPPIEDKPTAISQLGGRWGKKPAKKTMARRSATPAPLPRNV